MKITRVYGETRLREGASRLWIVTSNITINRSSVGVQPSGAEHFGGSKSG